MRQSIEVRAIIQEAQVAARLGHKIKMSDLQAMYGKDNVDRALLDPRFKREVVNDPR